MRLRKVKGASEHVMNSPMVIQDGKSLKGNWKSVFKNDNPIHVEIGMGKGKFITTLAALNKDINYIGIEQYDSVLVRALEKVEASEEVPSNLFFMCVNAADLTEFFAEEELSRIYLNFSDPWPKDRHAKRRLTSSAFLALYDKVLKKDGDICFKTDNRLLFDFSVEEVPSAGWKLSEVTYDLHNSPYNEGNIMTEYEEKFSAKGNPIFKYIIKR